MSKRRAEGTLLGVAPPSSGDVAPVQHQPVVVHAGLPRDEQAVPPSESVLQVARAAPGTAPPPPETTPPSRGTAPPPAAVFSLAPEPVHDEELLYPSLAPGAAAGPGAEPRVPPPLPWGLDAAADDQEQQPLRVKSALKLRVHAFGAERPLWTLLTPAVPVLVAVGVLLGVVVAPRHAAVPAPVVAQPAPVPVAPVVASPVALPPLDLAAIQAKPPESRTAAEALALAGVAADQRREAAAKRVQELLQSPALLKKKATISELGRLASDPLTAPPTLEAVANVPGPLGADLLYELWTGAPSKSEGAELSRALLASQDVHGKVSEALAVALQLRAVTAPSELGSLLDRIAQVGDKRSLGPLKKWKHKRPCSPASKSHDCLSHELGKAIDAAIDAVKGRRAPLDAH